MSFLAPLFLLGALALALPVIFHLIRRTTRKRTLFSSLMFLLPTPPRLTRRSRLEHLLLLALRCVALGLLAFGFARPFIKQTLRSEPPAGLARRQVILVDTSASMRRPDLWSEARAKTEAVLGQTTPADQVALFAFDRQVTSLVTFEQWNSAAWDGRAALARQRLAEMSPGWSATHLGNALIAAAEALDDTTGQPALGPRQIVLISDLQEGCRLDQLQGYEWPKGVELIVEPVKPRRPSNAGLQLVTDTDEPGRPSDPAVRLRVSNAADSKREQFKVGWVRSDRSAFAGNAIDVYVPPGQSRIVTLPALPAAGSVDRIGLQGDDADFDNTVYVIPPEAAQFVVLYCGSDSETNPRQPLYFLQRAFQQTRRQSVRVLARPASEAFAGDDADGASLFIVTDRLSDPNLRLLRERVLAGKTLLFAPQNAASASTLARLLGLEGLALVEGRPNGYAMLGEIDFRHPLFAPFADPRYSDFTKIHFWKYRRLDAAALPGARVLAKFDTGDAAMLEVPVGKGRLVVLTSGWHPDDSQLALSTKFVPLLYSLLEYSGTAAPPPAQYQVGDVVPLATLGLRPGAPVTLQPPEGSPMTLAAGETNFSRTLWPGVYAVTSRQPPSRFVVNLNPAESRTVPLSLDELERLGAPVPARASDAALEAQRKTRLQGAELENRQKLWRWFIVATLAVLLIESWLAGWTARRTLGQGEPAT